MIACLHDLREKFRDYFSLNLHTVGHTPTHTHLQITATGIRAVAVGLLGKAKLWRVNLRENELEDKGAVVLSKALAAVRE